MSAVWLLAKAEVRRRWPALLALAVLAALGGAMVTSSLVLARRTTTAYDRLTAATQPADAQVFVNVGPGGAEAVADLPGVESSWITQLGVGALGEERVYLALLGATDDPPADLFRPRIIDGRTPHEGAAEAMIAGETADSLAEAGIRVGDRLPLRFLTGDDYRSFDTGFGVPAGPEVEVTLVGTYQMAGGSEGVPPLLAAPGFARTHPDALAAGEVVFLRLDAGEAGIADLRRQLDGLERRFSVPPGGEEFDPFQVVVPGEARTELDTTARVLAAGLAALAGVAALVALVLLAQGFNRYHGGDTDAEPAHTALGLTAGQLLAARLVASLPVAVLAGVLAAAGAVAAAGLEPLGSLRQFEPHPGRVINTTLVAVGAVFTVVTVLLVVAATMTASTRRIRRQRTREAPRARSTRWAVGTPGAIGVRFTLSTDRAAAPMRSAVVGVAVAVIGVAAGLVFATSLDRLVETPARYGWGGELSIIDANAESARRVVGDPDIVGATLFTQTSVRIEQDRRYVVSYEDLKGDAGWWVMSGSLPTAPDQVLLEPRLAEQLGVGVGDDLVAGPAERLEVVGIGVGPNFGSGAFGEQALVTPAGAERLGGSAPFAEIVMDVAPGRSVAEVRERYARAYEMGDATAPPEIRNLSELGRLPELLTGFLAVIGLGAMANALWVSARRRRRDLAVLRVLGHTGRQSRATVVTMAVLAAAIGVVVGLPLGLAVGRTLWRVVAESSGVEGDSLVTVPVLAGLPLAALVVAGAVALPAAWYAVRRGPAETLRTE